MPDRILEAAPAKVGHDRPAYVRAEITLNVSKLADTVRHDWDSLRQGDVVYLLAIESTEASPTLTNGHSKQNGEEKSGLLALRTAEVVQLLDENGRSIREPRPEQTNGYGSRPRIRRLIVNLDPLAFKADGELKEKGRPDVYENLNVIVRRNQRANNFKKILETIQSLALSDVPVPAWLQEVFLGYGDPASATYARLSNKLKTIDFRDTFVDWQHLVDSFPGKVWITRFWRSVPIANASCRPLNLKTRSLRLFLLHMSFETLLPQLLLFSLDPRRSVDVTMSSLCSRLQSRSRYPRIVHLPADRTQAMYRSIILSASRRSRSRRLPQALNQV